MNGDGFEYVTSADLSSPRRKPYLTELPGDYVGDLVVLEWLEFLVAASDVTDAFRAINYYERIEWIGPDAGDRLRDFLSGFGSIDRNLVDRPGTDHLHLDHHTRSLRYITQLNGTNTHTLLLNRWDDLTGSFVGGEVGGATSGQPAPQPTASGHKRTANGHKRTASNHGRTAHGRQSSPPQQQGPGQSANDDYPPKHPAHDDHAAAPANAGAHEYANGHDAGRKRPGNGTDAGNDTGTEAGNGDGNGNRNGNGTEPRPMTDPNPRSGRDEPADGGWGHGR